MGVGGERRKRRRGINIRESEGWGKGKGSLIYGGWRKEKGVGLEEEGETNLIFDAKVTQTGK